MLRPIRRQSLSDAVFEQLRDQIVHGRLPPGSALPPERALADMLQVNRGALREALKRLAQARLVSIQHGGATRVANFIETAGLDLLGELILTPDNHVRTEVARSVMEMRSALAPDIAKLCAERADPDVARRLSDVTARMERAASDLPALQRLAVEFWGLLVEGSGNIAYRLAYNTLNGAYEQIFDLLTNVLEKELIDLPAYRAIANAVEDRDGESARSHAKALVAKGCDEILRVIRTLEALDTERKT